MSEKVEKVAIAFYENGGGQMLAGPNDVPPWSEVDPGFQDLFRQIARTAIGAMRDPTDTMLDAGYEVSHPIDGAIAYALVAEIWRAMTEAALKDEIK